MWEGELEFWGTQGLHVVVYNGSAAARSVIAEHELWLAPGCLDGRAPKRVTADMPHKVPQKNLLRTVGKELHAVMQAWQHQLAVSHKLLPQTHHISVPWVTIAGSSCCPCQQQRRRGTDLSSM